jgi:hypothetical protein
MINLLEGDRRFLSPMNRLFRKQLTKPKRGEHRPPSRLLNTQLVVHLQRISDPTLRFRRHTPSIDRLLSRSRQRIEASGLPCSHKRRFAVYIIRYCE